LQLTRHATTINLGDLLGHRRVEPAKIEIRFRRASPVRAHPLKASLIGARRSRSPSISTPLPCLHDQAEMGALPRQPIGNVRKFPCVRVSRQKRQDVILGELSHSVSKLVAYSTRGS
jgi:hypothetical protein